MPEQISNKEFFQIPLTPVGPVPEEMVKDCYAVFACRHKFCREVCPVYVEERNEAYIPYGFNTSILALGRGLGELRELKETFTYCLECGACELRCPNTLFAGDFYRRTTTTIDLVRKVRRDLLAAGIQYKNWAAVKETIDQHLNWYNGPTQDLTKWAQDLDIPRSGSLVMFVDYFDAFQTTEVPRLAAKILHAAGISFAILEKPSVTAGELLESDLPAWVEHAKRNIASLVEAGAKQVIIINPHEYVYFTREYPRRVGPLPFEVAFITDFLASLLNKGKLHLVRPVDRRATYHDPCTLNKQAGITESPRQLLGAVPGLDFVDEDPVTQWSYCCGNGVAAFKKIHPDIAYKIGVRRMRIAADLEAGDIIVGCPHCKDHFTEVRVKSGVPIAPRHLLEILAESMGVDGTAR